jgi:hypothetical protein
MNRRLNFQTLAWFNDLYLRELLDMDPPYQRRSVWNQNFKDYFVDTVLLNYPAPAIFLYEEMNPDGRSMYHVVDGKQRLTTLFEFTTNSFPVAENSEIQSLRGTYFNKFDDGMRRAFWSYQFLLEYVPAEDPKVITAIFDRINRNVAKLSAQELRHARLDGIFISAAEELTTWMGEQLPPGFPRFADQSRKQMKDTEFSALLLLLLEEGPRGYSQENLDEAFTTRDPEWDGRRESEARYKNAITFLSEALSSLEDKRTLTNGRLRNQADFYSLFGAVDSMLGRGTLPSPREAADRLIVFTQRVDDETARKDSKILRDYFDAARSASNDKGPRATRMEILEKVLSGQF